MKILLSKMSWVQGLDKPGPSSILFMYSNTSSMQDVCHMNSLMTYNYWQKYT